MKTNIQRSHRGLPVRPHWIVRATARTFETEQQLDIHSFARISPLSLFERLSLSLSLSLSLYRSLAVSSDKFFGSGIGK